MKRILFINDYLISGGAEKVLENYANHFEKENYRVYVAATGTRTEANSVFDSHIIFIPISRRSGKYRPWSIKWFFDRVLSRVETVFFHVWSHICVFDIAVAVKEYQPMLMIRSIKSKAKIGWIHTDHRFYHFRAKPFISAEEEFNFLQSFDRIVCVSSSAKDGVVQTIGDPGNLVVCLNPINYSQIRNLSKHVCSMEKNHNKLLFVSVGRLAAEKQFSMLIEACAHLEKLYDFELWIIGDGYEKDNLQSLIRDHDIRSVKLLGYKDNPYPYMAKADCYVSSSKAESYGLTIQESLILGVPVIATRCPATEETLDERFGVIAENSLSGLLYSMETILQNQTQLQIYRDNISKYYCLDELYEKRLEAVSLLFQRTDHFAVCDNNSEV